MADGHDTRYKKLFSHKELVREVLESFVHEDFVTQLDYGRMKRLNTSFVSERYRKHESDLIWEIPLSGESPVGSAGEPVYLYLLFEFQSTVDRFLPLRMLRYLCEFYEHLLRGARPRLKFLPPVFPLLLYNGERSWRAPLDIRDLIRPRVAADYLPAFRYFPLVEKDIPDAELVALRNAVAAVFYLEKSSTQDLGERLAVLGRLLAGLDHPLRRVLEGWFADYLRQLPDFERNCSILEECVVNEEGDSMLESAIRGVVAQGEARGKAEGKAEGLQATLIRLLERKFGITDAERARVRACTDLERLTAALDEILEATSADTVLGQLP